MVKWTGCFLKFPYVVKFWSLFMASIDDFVRRITRLNRRFTFVFTEDFFNISDKNGVRTDRFRDIRNAFKHVGHRKGMNAVLQRAEDVVLFDVDIVVVKSAFACYTTSFDELISGPFGKGSLIHGLGTEAIDAQKAKFQVDSFFSDKSNETMPINKMIADRRRRQLVLVVESPADLKRPSLEPIRNLRSQLCTILVSAVKGPIVDCQVTRIYQEGNSNSLSCLLNMFCVNYK